MTLEDAIQLVLLNEAIYEARRTSIIFDKAINLIISEAESKQQEDGLANVDISEYDPNCHICGNPDC